MITVGQVDGAVVCDQYAPVTDDQKVAAVYLRRQLFPGQLPPGTTLVIDRSRFADEYERVALVWVKSLEDAYAVTQNLDTPWWQVPGVQAYRPNLRSVSVGDVLLIRGEYWAVASLGFVRVMLL